jgi:pSer/pThr/pTyr-binding forkhead associated (FHA) protein
VSRVVIHVIPESGIPGDPQDLFFDEKEVITIGRAPDNDIVLLHDDLVSRHHAQLAVRPGRLILKDLESANGVFIRGRRITAPTIIKEPLPVSIGNYRLEVELVE